MGLFDEPDNEVYRLAKSGTLALLEAVNKADTVAASALGSKERPCDAVKAYLDASFLGPFLRSGEQIPYAENAGVLGTFVAFLDHELKRGASHATRLHQTHLKLLVYVQAIEADAPLSVFGNGSSSWGGSERTSTSALTARSPPRARSSMPWEVPVKVWSSRRRFRLCTTGCGNSSIVSSGTRSLIRPTASIAARSEWTSGAGGGSKRHEPSSRSRT